MFREEKKNKIIKYIFTGSVMYGSRSEILNRFIIYDCPLRSFSEEIWERGREQKNNNKKTLLRHPHHRRIVHIQQLGAADFDGNIAGKCAHRFTRQTSWNWLYSAPADCSRAVHSTLPSNLSRQLMMPIPEPDWRVFFSPLLWKHAHAHKIESRTRRLIPGEKKKLCINKQSWGTARSRKICSVLGTRVCKCQVRMQGFFLNFQFDSLSSGKPFRIHYAICMKK